MKSTTLVTAMSTIVMLSVFSYDRKQLQGELYSRHYQKTMEINDSLELLFAMERLMDSISFPRYYMEPRTFNSPKKFRQEAKTEGTDNMMQSNKEKSEGERKATFVIHVQFRRNASWQGEIRWVDEEKTQMFRSTLEMIKLIDDALGSVSDMAEMKWELE